MGSEIHVNLDDWVQTLSNEKHLKWETAVRRGSVLPGVIRELDGNTSYDELEYESLYLVEMVEEQGGPWQVSVYQMRSEHRVYGEGELVSFSRAASRRDAAELVEDFAADAVP